MRRFLLAAAVASALALSGPRAAVAAPETTRREIGLGAGQLLMGRPSRRSRSRCRVSDGTPFERSAWPRCSPVRRLSVGRCARSVRAARSDEGSCSSATGRCVSRCDSGPPTGPRGPAPENDGRGDGRPYAPSRDRAHGRHRAGRVDRGDHRMHIGKEERSVWGGVSAPPAFRARTISAGPSCAGGRRAARASRRTHGRLLVFDLLTRLRRRASRPSPSA